MIELFNIPQHNIDTSKFSHLLHDKIVTEFENNFAAYVGAKYACSANSASSLLYLALKHRRETVYVPSNIPIVVPNVILNTNNRIRFYNDIDWVGGCYHLHDNIFDSAQEVTKNQYADLKRDDALMIFSFYPTKPVSGCDGGMVVSNDKKQIDNFRILTMNGTEFSTDSWSRNQVTAGYKMHCNSIQAYVANENLKKIDAKNSILDEIRAVYNRELGYNNTSRHLYRIRVEDNTKFVKDMKRFAGIQCGIHYDCCHNNPVYRHCVKGNNMTPSEREAAQTVSLPFHEKLSYSDVYKVIDYVTRNS